MNTWENLLVNEMGHMIFGGCDMVELAERFGTPLYVMDENQIRESCRAFIKTLKEAEVDAQVLYASKAFSTQAIYKIVNQEGLGADVVSSGELYTALSAGMLPERIYLHGNNKSDEELEMALKAGIERIIIDNHEEIGRLSALCEKLGVTARVSIRIKPGIEAHTHEYIMTGANDSKFGLGIHDGEAMKAVRTILCEKSLQLVGIHAHIGSQIFELQPFVMVADIMTDFALRVKEECGYSLYEINFGGGYGIVYVDGDKPLQPHEYVAAIARAMKEACAKKGLEDMRFVIEPGRAIVGPAGITLYKVGGVKKVQGGRTYVAVDGGMADNPRYALYQAQYMAKIANKPNAANAGKITVAGRCCESGDVLIDGIDLPACEAGDILAVFSTGAYNYSMASNYNRLPHPAVVLVNDGRADLIVKRQTLEQIVQNDIVPDRLK